MSVRWALLAILCLLGPAACGRGEQHAASGASRSAAPRELALNDESRKYLVIAPAGASDGSFERTYFGRTAFRPKALSAVTPLFAGRIAAVAVEPGKAVKRGAILFVIDSPDVLALRTAAAQARLKVQLAEEVLSRQNEAMRRGVGLEMERFEAEMKAREARSELERAERNAALAGAGEGTQVQVRAPVSGIVVSVKATVGAAVQPGGEPLVEVGDPNGLWVVADVPEGEADLVARATRAQVAITALDLRLPGHIAGIAPRSETETRRAPFYVDLEGRPEGLRAGLLARVTVSGAAAVAELTLPVTAVLLKQSGRRIVYVEDAAGRFHAREVEVGDERGGRVRILKGVDPGERVVMRGALLVDREAELLL